MKKKLSWMDNYLSNNGKFTKSNILYRNVFLLNIVLVMTAVECFIFAALDLYISKLYEIALATAICAFLSIIILLYFKKSNNYKVTVYLTIATIFIFLIIYFNTAQNKYYALCWAVIFPTIVYTLFEVKEASIIVGIFSGYMLYFMFSNKMTWSPAEFDIVSIINIAEVALCIVLIVTFNEKSKNGIWAELQKTNKQLADSHSELQLILDSSAEGILGVDLNNSITFCNKSSLRMLGYSDQKDLIGQSIHRLIYHTYSDGTPFPVEECGIFRTLINGESYHSSDDVYWRPDGTFFDVEYYSYPQTKDGITTGAVVTIWDISERKKREEKIQYLSCYDTLTKLYNRRCFEENLTKIDIQDNLPISVIFSDVNGLKMTNDIFGHSAGDELIKTSSDILRKSCRQTDFIARVGGDEFIVLLPNTSGETAEKVVASIKSEFENAQVQAIKCSMSLGYDTKRIPEQSMDEIITNAENAMYKDKTLNRSTINNDIINTISETLYTKSPVEKQHAIGTSNLCADFGYILGLPEPEISKMRRAGSLHDIGKIVLDDSILLKDWKDALTEGEIDEMKQHSVVGYRILNLFDTTLDLAEYVYGHHERWDGSGYPRGLKGEQIPIVSRIISIVETYDRIINRNERPSEDQKSFALDVIKNGEGTQFDPQIAESFVQMIKKREGI